MPTGRNIQVGIVAGAIVAVTLSLPACGTGGGNATDTGDPAVATSGKTAGRNPTGGTPDSKADGTVTDGSGQSVPQDPIASDESGQAGVLTSQTLHSDGQRVVLHSTDASDPTYIVLTYSGADITGLYTCIEQGSAEEAQTAASAIVPNEGEGVRAAYADGTCLVIEHTPEAYRDLTIASLSEAYPGMIWV